MRQWWSSTEVCLAAAVAVAVAACLTFLSTSPKRSATADGWRRTANGWEQVQHWQPVRAAGRSETSGEKEARIAGAAPRLDTHPAVIALGQLVLVLLVLASFPRRAAPASQQLAAWRATISSSFRASVFGS